MIMPRPTFVLTTAAVLAAAGLSASAGPRLSALPTNLSPRCAELARVPADAKIMTPRIAAQVSVANCTAEEAMNKLTLAPTDASIAQLNAAVSPSLALLDDVVTNVNDPYWKIIATDAKRDLFSSMVVRQRNSISGVNMAARDALEPKLVAWQARAASAGPSVPQLSRAHPDLASRDQVIGYIAQNATSENPSQVAMRHK